MHRILKLEQTKRLCIVECSNEITITIINMDQKFGGWVQSNTKSPRLRPTSIPSGILMHAAIWPQQIWAENWVGAVPLWRRGSWVPIKHNVARAETYLHAKFHLDPSNRLATVHERHRQNRTDRQDRQTDNGLIAWGEPFYQRSPKNL